MCYHADWLRVDGLLQHVRAAPVRHLDVDEPFSVGDGIGDPDVHAEALPEKVGEGRIVGGGRATTCRRRLACRAGA